MEGERQGAARLRPALGGRFGVRGRPLPQEAGGGQTVAAPRPRPLSGHEAGVGGDARWRCPGRPAPPQARWVRSVFSGVPVPGSDPDAQPGGSTHLQP